MAPQAGIKPSPPAVEVRGLNHGATREAQNMTRRFPITSSMGHSFLAFMQVRLFRAWSLSACYVLCALLDAGGRAEEGGGPAVLHGATLCGRGVCRVVGLLLDFSTCASVRGHRSSPSPASSASTGARVTLWAARTASTQRIRFLGAWTPTHKPSLGKVWAHFSVSFALRLFRVLKSPL